MLVELHYDVAEFFIGCSLNNVGISLTRIMSHQCRRCSFTPKSSETNMRYLGAYVVRLMLLSPQEDLRPSIFILTSQWPHGFCGDVWNTRSVQPVSIYYVAKCVNG